ncbi:MAG: hypothetical protein ACOVVK_09225 [Elsteraceae bacterium]
MSLELDVFFVRDRGWIALVDPCQRASQDLVDQVKFSVNVTPRGMKGPRRVLHPRLDDRLLPPFDGLYEDKDRRERYQRRRRADRPLRKILGPSSIEFPFKNLAGRGSDHGFITFG